ncbi:MAG TPA: PPOX class F420-dependent oxidoreductase [Thermomicrobiales bacterium]|nr:PPOX class F420-dependent oxidoreductase [Thermomicrobiales bacterium]
MVEIRDDVRELLEQPVLYNLATVNPNGTIQVNPVWGEIHDGKIRINTAVGRRKHRNLAERGDKVTVMVQDPSDPLRYVEIRGKVTEMTEANGDEIIDRLAKKYLGVDTYPEHREDETRVTIMIEPTRIFG